MPGLNSSLVVSASIISVASRTIHSGSKYQAVMAGFPISVAQHAVLAALLSAGTRSDPRPAEELCTSVSRRLAEPFSCRECFSELSR